MKEKISAILTAIKNDMADTWKRGKMVLLAIITVIAAIEYKKITNAVQTYLNNKKIKDTQNKDIKLSSDEDSNNIKANKLIKDASTIAKDTPNVDENWYKEDK